MAVIYSAADEPIFISDGLAAQLRREGLLAVKERNSPRRLTQAGEAWFRGLSEEKKREAQR